MSSPEHTGTETEKPTHTGRFRITDHNIARTFARYIAQPGHRWHTGTHHLTTLQPKATR